MAEIRPPLPSAQRLVPIAQSFSPSVLGLLTSVFRYPLPTTNCTRSEPAAWQERSVKLQTALLEHLLDAKDKYD